MSAPTRHDILTALVAEALDDPTTGWLSDIGVHSTDLEYDSSNQTIIIYSPEHRNALDMGYQGSIDVGQLAGVVESLALDAAG